MTAPGAKAHDAAAITRNKKTVRSTGDKIAEYQSIFSLVRMGLNGE